MHGFTYDPATRRWFKPEEGGIWYDAGRGEYFSERLQAWTVGGVWPVQSGPSAPALPLSPPSGGARLRAANSGSWTIDGGDDPILPVRESLFALPRLDRCRLLAWLIDELDEPDDKQGFEEFRDRVRREGLSWTDRPGIYRLFGGEAPSEPRRRSSPPSQETREIADAFRTVIRGFTKPDPANGPERPRIKGRRRP